MFFVLLLILLERALFPNGVRIVGKWCSTPCTEANETLDYVPILLVTLRCTFYRCPSPGVFRFIPLLYSSSPSLSPYVSVASVFCAPDISRPACSHHCIPIRAPWVLSVASQRSRSDRVTMYCATVFCLCRMYVSNPASALDASSKTLRWKPYPPPLTSAVASAPPPSCTEMCTGAAHSGPAMAPACHTEFHVGGRGCLPPVSPQCPGCASTRSASTWLSACLTGGYIPKLGRASALPSPETPYWNSWAHRPRLPCHPPALIPFLPRRNGFVGAQPATYLSSPSRTLGVEPVPAVSPCSSFPPLSSDRYGVCLPVPPLPDSDDIPSQWFSWRFFAFPPGQRVMS